MSPSELSTVVIEVLHGVAPESAQIELRPEVNFRQQFDFDSLDFLNFAIALHARLGVEIPETDYPSLSSLDGAVAYLGPRLTVVEDA